jgi:glycosyltransferase involved in cell wall biosynthesis
MHEPSSARIAVVHEWLLDYAGSERVVAEILRCFPHAQLFALVDHMAESDRRFLGGRRATTTFLQRMPGAASRLKYYVPLMPLAIEQLDLTDFDLVLSSNHAVAKGVIVSPDALHLSYVHSPMRYAWDQQFVYLAGEKPGRLRQALMRWQLHRLRLWDHRAAAGVDYFIANSRFVARRILKAYRRTADVIYPPVATEYFVPGGGQREDFYVAVSRLIAYKRVDLMVEAFRALPQRRLVVIGEGPDRGRLEAAAPANVTFAGFLPADEVRERLRRARAFVFPAVEDFGIAPVEAMACGTPVVALRRGGAAETVEGLESDAPTGAFFEEQSPAALAAAVQRFEEQAGRVTANACRAQAEKFGAARFREELQSYVAARYAAWKAGER